MILKALVGLLLSVFMFTSGLMYGRGLELSIKNSTFEAAEVNAALERDRADVAEGMVRILLRSCASVPEE